MSLFTDDIKTNTEAQIAVVNWIKALRSGEYAQATGYLRTPEGFCCLGVACDLIDPSQWNPETPGLEEYFSYGIDLAGLPPDIQDAYCMRTADGWFRGENGSLAAMNDSGKTFAEIADVIERELTEALA